MIKVFLVEDESLIRESLKNNIAWEQYGYKLVGDASDGEMALPLIRKTRPDVIITDIKMPFMDGLSLSKIVCSEFPKTKIIIISGHDDFDYARQAIEIGVEEYLLKPITKMNLRKVLLEVKEKIEADANAEDYQSWYQDEMQEYEQFARRRFFDKVLQGKMSVKDIYEEASKLSLELTAPAYCLLFFYLQEINTTGVNSEKAEDFMKEKMEILHYFMRHPQYVLFAWNLNCYGVCIKAESADMEMLIENAVTCLKKHCENHDNLEWYVAYSNTVERLSMLQDSFKDVNRYLAYRFLLPEIHILNEVTLKDQLSLQTDTNIKHVNSSNMDPGIIKDFIAKGNEGEIREFVNSYLQGVREALESRMFRDYMVLNIRFAVHSFVEENGASIEHHSELLQNSYTDLNMNPEEISDYFSDMLRAAMMIRDEKGEPQRQKILRKVLDYINQNYDKESLSLNNVADAVEVTPNYLSALFSQSMQKTFVEYVTAKRMEKAKKLLKTTDKTLSEIAWEVGYKDSHYFSFVFKKTVGVSPREYR